MKAFTIIACAMLLLSGCVEETTPKEAEKAAEVVGKNIEQDVIKQRQLSIDQAAEEATKLIEADAKAEVDELIGENSAN